MTRRRWLALAALLIVVLLGGRFVAALVVDYRWFDALGPGPLAVWRARVTGLAALRVLLTLAGAGFAFANLAGVSTSVESFVLPRRLGDLEIGESVPGRQLLGAAALLAFLLGVALSFLVGDWMAFDRVQFARPFGTPEPYTGGDVGFFLYWLPFENDLYLWAIATFLATSALVVALYALTSGLRWENGRLFASRHVRRHVLALAAALLLLLAWAHRLDAYTLLTGGSGAGGAFVYIDHVIGLRTRFLLATLTAVGALVMLIAARQANGRLAFWIVTAVIGATALLRGVVPFLAVQAIGRATLIDRNGPYLRNRAAMTQAAFGVNRVTVAPRYGFASVERAADATPIWDPTALARAVERVRRGEIAGDDVGWQVMNGRLAAIVVTHAATAADVEPTAWTAVAASAMSVDGRGDPLGLEPASASAGAVAPLSDERRPRRFVSFPHAAGYAIVSDSARRVAGDPVGGPVARLLHAWNARDFRLLFSDALERVPAPVLVQRRDVRERLAAVAPFFAQGHSVTPLLARDTVYWVCHLYAASADFPLSVRYSVDEVVYGYYQHAAVGIVNAESGRIALVADAAPDRVTADWVARFPALFTDPAELRPELAAALPPATDGVLLQGWTLAQYGRRGVTMPAGAHVPIGEGRDSTLSGASRAVGLLPTPRGDTLTAGWTLPLVDEADRVAGLLVALGGTTSSTLWIAAPSSPTSWPEVTARLRNAVTEGQARTPEGAAAEAPELRAGQTRAIPLDSALAYVAPIYALRSGGSPALVGAVASLHDRVRIGATVREALGAPAVGQPTAGTATMPTVAPDRARSLYDAMRAALRRGDWAAFGAAFDSLGAALARAPR